MSQAEVQKRITMYKNISSPEDSFGIEFELWGENLKRVNSLSIRVPNGRRVQFSNRLDFNNFLFSSDNMNSTQFSRQFPEGEYKIDLSPWAYGKFTINMLYNFPDLLITSPSDGATDVPLNQSIQWGALGNINSLTITIRSGSNELTNNLAIGDTSFAPSGGWNLSTQYDVSLRAEVVDFEGNRLITTHTISFTTGTQ
jgi:hypothetical protein